jgi:F-type H+-transporting ATPase subunit b
MLEFTLRGFIYAIINFLLLVALLYKFMHKPLLNILETRRKKIQARKEEADEKQREAQKLKDEYEHKLAGIGEERSEMLSEAKEQTEKQREKILNQARETAKKETENARRDWERRRTDALENLREDIAKTAVELAGAILGKLTGGDVEAALRGVVEDELETLARANEDERRGLTAKDSPVRVVSATELDQEQRDRLAAAVRKITGEETGVNFDIRDDLIGGLRVEFVSRAVDGSIGGILDDMLRDLATRRGSHAEGQNNAARNAADRPDNAASPEDDTGDDAEAEPETGESERENEGGNGDKGESS